jgi:hypothetical protein
VAPASGAVDTVRRKSDERRRARREQKQAARAQPSEKARPKLGSKVIVVPTTRTTSPATGQKAPPKAATAVVPQAQEAPKVPTEAAQLPQPRQPQSAGPPEPAAPLREALEPSSVAREVVRTSGLLRGGLDLGPAPGPKRSLSNARRSLSIGLSQDGTSSPQLLDGDMVFIHRPADGVSMWCRVTVLADDRRIVAPCHPPASVLPKGPYTVAVALPAGEPAAPPAAPVTAPMSAGARKHPGTEENAAAKPAQPLSSHKDKTDDDKEPAAKMLSKPSGSKSLASDKKAVGKGAVPVKMAAKAVKRQAGADDEREEEARPAKQAKVATRPSKRQDEVAAAPKKSPDKAKKSPDKAKKSPGKAKTSPDKAKKSPPDQEKASPAAKSGKGVPIDGKEGGPSGSKRAEAIRKAAAENVQLRRYGKKRGAAQQDADEEEEAGDTSEKMSAHGAKPAAGNEGKSPDRRAAASTLSKSPPRRHADADIAAVDHKAPLRGADPADIAGNGKALVRQSSARTADAAKVLASVGAAVGVVAASAAAALPVQHVAAAMGDGSPQLVANGAPVDPPVIVIDDEQEENPASAAQASGLTWGCRHCTLENAEARVTCKACDNPRDSAPIEEEVDEEAEGKLKRAASVPQPPRLARAGSARRKSDSNRDATEIASWAERDAEPAHAAKRQRQEQAALFVDSRGQPVQFTLTGFSADSSKKRSTKLQEAIQEEKAELERLIVGHGGAIVDLNTFVRDREAGKRAGGNVAVYAPDAKEPTPVATNDMLVVVSAPTKGETMKAKALFSFARGLSTVSAEWVRNCVRVGRVVAPLGQAFTVQRVSRNRSQTDESERLGLVPIPMESRLLHGHGRWFVFGDAELTLVVREAGGVLASLQCSNRKGGTPCRCQSSIGCEFVVAEYLRSEPHKLSERFKDRMGAELEYIERHVVSGAFFGWLRRCLKANKFNKPFENDKFKASLKG